MYKRIMARSRSLLTWKIKKTINHAFKKDKTKKVTTVEIRKLKQMIQLLESSETNNNHINIIKSVTDDEKDLNNEDNLSVTSNDVLDRLEVYFEIE